MATIAETAAKLPGCPGGLVAGMQEAQLSALHAYKHALITETFRLYKEVPAARADKVIAHFFQEILNGIG